MEKINKHHLDTKIHTCDKFQKGDFHKFHFREIFLNCIEYYIEKFFSLS